MVGQLCETDARVQYEVVELIGWMKKMKLANIRQDIEPLLAETSEGVERIASIVNSLRILD
jgi:hypothetical protein